MSGYVIIFHCSIMCEFNHVAIKVAMEMLKPVDECTNMVGPPFDVKDVGLVVNINLSKLTRIPSWLHPFKE